MSLLKVPSFRLAIAREDVAKMFMDDFYMRWLNSALRPEDDIAKISKTVEGSTKFGKESTPAENINGHSQKDSTGITNGNVEAIGNGSSTDINSTKEKSSTPDTSTMRSTTPTGPMSRVSVPPAENPQ